MTEDIDKLIGKTVVIASEKCPYCQAVKKAYEEKKSEFEGKVEILEVEKSELGRKIADKLNIMYVPTFLTFLEKDKEKGEYYVCFLENILKEGKKDLKDEELEKYCKVISKKDLE